MLQTCSVSLFTYRESKSGKNPSLFQCMRVCSSETTKLADLCDLVGHDDFGLNAVSFLTLVR